MFPILVMKSLKSNRFSIIPKLLDTATKQIHESIGKRIILYDIKVFSMSKNRMDNGFVAQHFYSYIVFRCKSISISTHARVILGHLGSWLFQILESFSQVFVSESGRFFLRSNILVIINPESH